jgi:hypothetical protein
VGDWRACVTDVLFGFIHQGACRATNPFPSGKGNRIVGKKALTILLVVVFGWHPTEGSFVPSEIVFAVSGCLLISGEAGGYLRRFSIDQE